MRLSKQERGQLEVVRIHAQGLADASELASDKGRLEPSDLAKMIRVARQCVDKLCTLAGEPDDDDDEDEEHEQLEESHD